MKATRAYTMTTRARAADRTRRRILEGAVSLAATRLVSEISLDDIAAAAGVSVQTVLRHFGNRAGLLEAARRHAIEVIQEERNAPAGDIPAAVAAVVDHYERRGDGVVLMLAQEHSDEQIREIVADGRRFHARWVETVFAPYLPQGRTGRDELVALLAVATDVYTWKQLRRDHGASRSVTEQRMARLVRGVLDVAED